jgi:hypothetical protein
MTDMTTDTHHTSPETRAKHSAPMREYYVYFAVIFAATLPLTILTWVLTTLRRIADPSRLPGRRPGLSRRGSLARDLKFRGQTRGRSSPFRPGVVKWNRG